MFLFLLKGAARRDFVHLKKGTLVIFVIFVIIFDKMPKRKGLKFNLPEI
jgi:hypothetical protein